MRVLITGGAGFIGSNFTEYMLEKHKNYSITVYDSMTYASNPGTIARFKKNSNFSFIRGDIRNAAKVDKAVKKCDVIINFAAETHVDRSILEPGIFVDTNIKGVDNILSAVKKNKIKKFIQISTDEVYGSVKTGKSIETDRLNPASPYSSTKAAADLLCLSHFKTFKTPVIITRSSNNFGPYQHPEKFIPLFITNAIDGALLPLYGDGKNVRNWIFVMDNCSAIDAVLHKGKAGEVYNIGGNTEEPNIKVAKLILKQLKRGEKLIKYVKDRPAHDRRYALNSAKVKKLGWKPGISFEKALELTVAWYIKNNEWWGKLKNRNFKKYYGQMYTNRR